jgi:hypothetical protein
MMIKRFLLFIAVILMVSCSNEDNSKIPGITPSEIELSTAHPEALFQFIEGDYAMYEFRINYGKIDTEVSKRITKDILSKAQTVVELSDGNKATIYCKNGILQKIEFDFMTISKVQTGKYKVQLNKNSIQQVPIGIFFGFSAPEGMPTMGITFK